MTLPIFPVLPGLTFTSVKSPVFNTIMNRAPNAYEVRIAQTINPVWDWLLLYDFLHDFPWGNQYKLVSELRTLMGFLNQVGGKALPFLYMDPDDYSVGPALSTAAWQAGIYYPLNFGIMDSANHWQQVITPGYSGSSIPAFNDTGGTTPDGPSTPQLTWQDHGSYPSGFPNTPLAQLPLVTDGAGNWFSPIQRTLDGVFYEDITDLNGNIAVYLNGVLKMNPADYTLGGPGLALLPTAGYMGMYIAWKQTLSAWQASHAYALNALILDPSGHIQKATTAGTSGTSIPPFNDSGGTTPDGTGSLVWTDQGYNPSPVGPVTAAFNFYFRVRFDSDSQDFEKFLGVGSAAAAGQGGGYWTIGGSNSQQGSGTLRLTSARPNSA